MLVIYNPTAGRRRIATLWRVLDILAGHGIRFDVAETGHRGHAQSLASTAAADGRRIVVAAGGDGTIAEVANGLLGSPTALGIIPLGTANVLAHELGLPFAARGVAAALAFGRTRTLWPGVIRQGNETRLFVQMMGAGFDAQVVHSLPLGLKRCIGRGAYVVQTLRESFNHTHDPITLRVDGWETQASSVVVSKGRLYGGPFLLAPNARPGEPGFSVVLFAPASPMRTLMHAAALPLGLLGKMPGVTHLRASDVEFVGNRPVPVQADGDIAGFLPATVTNPAGPISVVMA